MEQPTHDQVTPGSSLEVAGPQSIVDGLAQLVRLPLAVVLLPWPEHAPVRAVANYWTSPDSGPETLKTLEGLLLEQLNAEGPLGFLQDERLPGLTTWAEPVRLDPGRAAGALGVTRDNTEQWSESEISTIRVLAATCGALWARASAEHQQGLDELVAQVAERLMIATLSNLQEILDWTIETFARFIDADVALYRRNDHAAGLSILVAEYPKRPEIPDPDPLAAVPFEADPIFMALRDLKEPLIIRKSSSPEDYNTRVEEGSGIGNFSGAAVPLLNGDETEACLGFLHFRDVEWTTPEINALQTLATMLRQLNARIDAESRLQHIALHDDLTGLPNRRAMLEELDRRLSGTNGQTALLFMDLDRFKFMNDYLGHGAGDRVLLTIADRIRMSIRPSDFVARLGGDEFVILMNGADGELGALATASRLLDLVSQPVEVNQQHVSHTASAGIAIGNSHSLSGIEMLGRADVALYAAKTQGRNRAVIFDDVLRLTVDERSDTEMMLRDAMERGGLRLFYQAEFDLNTGQILAVEALVRCDDPERGLIAAGKFIAVAEETGLVVDIGHWVMEEACRQMAVWRDRYPGIDLVMRVNMSPAQLSVPGIIDHISRCLRHNNLLGSALCLELTEHAVMQDIERSIQILNEFRALGVRLALDDFGTGFSSMAQLKRIPITALKVDMSFVMGLADDPADQAIVEAIVHLSESFGLDLVAEGVERTEDLEELLRLGCHRAQGFLLAKPCPAVELDPVLWRGGIDLSALA